MSNNDNYIQIEMQKYLDNHVISSPYYAYAILNGVSVSPKFISPNICINDGDSPQPHIDSQAAYKTYEKTIQYLNIESAVKTKMIEALCVGLCVLFILLLNKP